MQPSLIVYEKILVERCALLVNTVLGSILSMLSCSECVLYDLNCFSACKDSYLAKIMATFKIGFEIIERVNFCTCHGILQSFHILGGLTGDVMTSCVDDVSEIVDLVGHNGTSLCLCSYARTV